MIHVHYYCYYFYSPFQLFRSAGEISECYENLAADQQMILELRKKAAAAERRADKLLTAMERWRLPVLYMKLLRNQFLSNRDAAIWEKVSKNFDNRDIMAAIKNALEEPLVPAPRPLVQKCAPVVAKVDTNNPKPPSVGSDPPSVWSANSIVAGLGTVARSYKRSFKTVADLNEGDGDLLDDACGPACGPREKQASRVGGTSRRASQNPLLRQNSNATRAYRPPTPNSRPLTGTPAKKREVSKAPADVPPPSGLLSFVTSLFSSSAKTDCESPVAKTDPGNFSSDYTDLAADTTSTCVDNSCGPEMFSTELEVTIPKKPTDEPSVPIISKKTSQRCHSPIKNASLRQEVSQEVTAGFFRQSTLNEKSASRHHAEETSVKRGEETSTRLGEKRRPRFHGEETSARHLGEEGATHHEERMRSIYGEERSRRIYAAETSRRQERLSRVQHDDRERSFRGERSTREVSLNSATKKRAKQQTPTQESHQRGRGASDNIGNTVSRILAAMGV
ncbi:hypothetical protein B484DRAFT_24768 [Ochromonadaceae sp. CCMP2298]|nr:hypothetical protein B484DRAFT_24768 [Ochromonadaceae sp. CCMP2298]